VVGSGSNFGNARLAVASPARSITTTISYNAAMKLQFSLATLLVCMTVLSGVCAAAVALPVREAAIVATDVSCSGPRPPQLTIMVMSRQPTTSEIAIRIAWVAPLTLAATFGGLWTIRRLKFRRENGPPVG
jgi:hypothetical protein